VHELVASLRAMDIWLNSNQLTSLLAVVDPDASGTISLPELRHFWVCVRAHALDRFFFCGRVSGVRVGVFVCTQAPDTLIVCTLV
jgi:hypothetical protein